MRGTALAFFLLVALFLGLPGAGFWNVFPVADAASVDAVSLFVELRDIHDDSSLRRELRDAVRAVRRVSDRAPSRYTVDGELVRASDLRRWRVLEVARDDVARVTRELYANPAVVSVRIEQLYETAFVPSDALFADQWGLASAALADIKAPAAWNVTTGSSSTVIAVIDGGVDLTHEDLRDKVWINPGEIPGNHRDDDGNGFVDDVHGWDFVEDQPASVPHNHATHVAGIAAASGDNGIGVAGVDWGAHIMSVRVLNSSGVGREEHIIRGIDYAVAAGADVINLSLVGRRSPALLAAVENAYAAGVVVVAAAGNSGLNTDFVDVYPVCAEAAGVNMVLGVGATDNDGEPASFSNYGRCVDISAPGKRIVSSVVGNRYRAMSGTSMSSPFVAGVVGLYLALHPGASPADVIAQVRSGDPFVGRRADRWNAQFKGKLNAARVVGAPYAPGATGDEQGATGDGGSRKASPRGERATGKPEFSVALSVPDFVQSGSDLHYSLSVSNSGTGSASDVSVTDRFDRDLIFSADASSGGCREDGRSVVCVRDELGAGETAAFDIVFSVPDTVRCSSSFRARPSVYALERGRSRRQASADSVVSRVVCE